MRLKTKTQFPLFLTALGVLVGCEASAPFDPMTGPEAAGGPVLTLRGRVVSAEDGSPVPGAQIRIYAPGKPFTFPFTAASTIATDGGSYLLRLPTSFGDGPSCAVWRLSARAAGFTTEGDVGGVLCTSDPQDIDFELDPVD
jgi:hypothetical protein